MRRASLEIVNNNILVFLHYGHVGFEDKDITYNRLILVDWMQGNILAVGLPKLFYSVLLLTSGTYIA